ncbi:hypothetical protein PFISCL1PPCAC_27807 [Pristionchus fissidentatus]|uniref:Uncharacterized protein n=1 Tax=Pristionchus fissidentatus TaxID=1538716 RepID=A0AAV5X0T9_9BILA|nr:hypothetical protein PFISCL1PPCAC_27807 [Pristionchus fissidentatus]
MRTTSVVLLLITFADVVNSDCFNRDYGLTGLGTDNDTCYVLFENSKVEAGYVDNEIVALLQGKNVVTCDSIEDAFKKEKSPFACNCTGMICNGHALMEARHAIGLMHDESPPEW